MERMIPFADIEGARRSRERIEKEREKELVKSAPSIKEVKSMSNKGDAHARHKYIEEHKAEIIADFVKLGTKAMLGQWGISAGGWTNIQKRWAVDIEAVHKGSPEAKKAPTDVPFDYERVYHELQARFEGYRQAVLDILGQ